MKIDDIRTDHTPYPETDFSPALQRTLKRKLENAQVESVDREEFFKTLGRAAKPRDESSDESR